MTDQYSNARVLIGNVSMPLDPGTLFIFISTAVSVCAFSTKMCVNELSKIAYLNWER